MAEINMEVTDTETTKSSTSGEVTTNVEGTSGFLFAETNIKLSGKVLSSRDNTRSTNPAKYQIHVAACQQQPTEGMSKLMDILSSCVEKITDGKQEPDTSK